MIPENGKTMKHYKNAVTMLLTAAVFLISVFMVGFTGLIEPKNSTADDTWKVEFEKSLLENYGVTPDHYEDLGNGVYQVYVEIDGKRVTYVAVDSATGDYYG